MKIGIMTFWWSNDNYGQVLQCYALQKYLMDLGHDVFLIRYNYNSDLYKSPKSPFYKKCLKAINPILLFRYFINKKKQLAIVIEGKKNDRQFENFRKRYINSSENYYNTFLELKNSPPVADIYIVGSDQVWNWKYLDAPRSVSYRPMFLDFGAERIKRIAYAASWGVSEIPDELKNKIKPLLSKFNYIGVRELIGIDLCKQCGRSDAEWVCDPTLLITSDVYRKLYNENEIRKPKEKYLLLYMLNNDTDFSIQYVYDFAYKKGLRVIYITGNGVIDQREKFFATIPEWLYLVDNAEYIITNSFHCCVFSTIFHKQFGAIPLSGLQVGMNSRFESLFELIGTGNRFISSTDFHVLEKKYEVKPVEVSERFNKVF